MLDMDFYQTEGGVEIAYTTKDVPYLNAINPYIEQLNTQRGAVYISNFEYPGRYTCWDIGFVNPPLALTVTDQQIHMEALNQRGEVLLPMCKEALQAVSVISLSQQGSRKLDIHIQHTSHSFTEEQRSQQPSVFHVIRALLAFFKSDTEPYLGLYGALGYDLIFQFESLEKHLKRDALQRDMVLYLPDELVIVNHRKETACIRQYDFSYSGSTTRSLPREGVSAPYQAKDKPHQSSDHQPGEYADLVNVAKESFRRGDLFEVVLGQIFYAECSTQPADLFNNMRKKNPSPYGFFINLGDAEYLVGASPEMYVRVQGRMVETCPISGTIARGSNAIEDANNIQTLLESVKDASELTMCTDVDRNDKSRICEAGSVNVVGRRQIEMYSRLIHTVDHVQGTLRPEFDAVDAFLSHMWVVTVTGAPKLWAMQFIETHEKSPRKWYGGAIGWFNFNGNLNTGLVLRTFRVKEGIAEIRAGATLLFDSHAIAEEQETRLKASAFLEILAPQKASSQDIQQSVPLVGQGKQVLVIDHQDSFVHTLANYFRQTGAEVVTVRYDQARAWLDKRPWNLVVLSPGPGCPQDFNLRHTIDAILTTKTPIFGVCLGLQGIVEYFGGKLDTLDYPVHGKASEIRVLQPDNVLLKGLGGSFTAGRYHSLYAQKGSFPTVLEATAETEDGVIMAISHRTLPVHAVQFHPETILSLAQSVGMKIIHNVMEASGPCL